MGKYGYLHIMTLMNHYAFLLGFPSYIPLLPFDVEILNRHHDETAYAQPNTKKTSFYRNITWLTFGRNSIAYFPISFDNTQKH